VPYATPEEAIRAKLAAGLTTVGNPPRINPQVNTQEYTLPFVVFKRIGGARNLRLDGTAGMGRYLFQVDVYATTEAGAKAVTAEVESALFPSGGWRDATNNVLGAFPDDSSVDMTDDPFRVWTRLLGVWFQG
jgi:hypothetical protein